MKNAKSMGNPRTCSLPETVLLLYNLKRIRSKSKEKKMSPSTWKSYLWVAQAMPTATDSKQLKMWTLAKCKQMFTCNEGKAVILMYEREWLARTDCSFAGINHGYLALTHIPVSAKLEQPDLSWIRIHKFEWQASIYQPNCQAVLFYPPRKKYSSLREKEAEPPKGLPLHLNKPSQANQQNLHGHFTSIDLEISHHR